MINNSVRASYSPPKVEDLDQALIRAALQGNKSSFSALIQKHEPWIFLMVYRQLRQREEAEDVVQQVFLKTFEQLKNFRGESKFSTWLYTIALNLTRNHVRQRKLRRMDSLAGPATTEESLGPQWPERLPSPEKIVQDRWDLAQVFAALESAPNLHRSIFTLHYIQHFSLKEVAVQVGRRVGTVKVYLHRARKIILAQLESQDKI